MQAINWDLVKKEQKVDESVKSVEWAKPGTLQGYEQLASFITNRIKIYDKQRNDPNVKGWKISKTICHAFKSSKKTNEKVCLILPYESKIGQIDKLKAPYYIN